MVGARRWGGATKAWACLAAHPIAAIIIAVFMAKKRIRCGATARLFSFDGGPFVVSYKRLRWCKCTLLKSSSRPRSTRSSSTAVDDQQYIKKSPKEFTEHNWRYFEPHPAKSSQTQMPCYPSPSTTQDLNPKHTWGVQLLQLPPPLNTTIICRNLRVVVPESLHNTHPLNEKKVIYLSWGGSLPAGATKPSSFTLSNTTDWWFGTIILNKYKWFPNC